MNRPDYSRHLAQLTEKLRTMTKLELATMFASELMAWYPDLDASGQFDQALFAVHRNWLAAGSPPETPDLRLVPSPKRSEP